MTLDEAKALILWARGHGAVRVSVEGLELEFAPSQERPEQPAKPSPEDERKHVLALRYRSGVLPPECE